MAKGLAALRAQGVEGLAVLGLVNRHLSPEAAWSLVPSWVEHRGDAGLDETADLLAFAREHDPALIPFVDTRHLWGDVPAVLGRLVGDGFRGLKGICLADEPNDLGVGSAPRAFGITREAYLRREWEVFAFAQARGLPVIYHVDVRRQADLVQAMLDDFPGVRFDLPHFGLGRRALGRVFERHANAFTDLASMLPHVRSDPAGYRDFLCQHPDRVCFGSDAFLYRLDTVLEYLQMVRDLALPEDVEARVLSINPRCFLGLRPGA